MKKVITFGVFDYFHYGHLKLLERCKALGDYLIVATQDDENVIKNKPNCNLLYPLDERMEMIKALKIVDEVIPYSQVDETIKEVDFDILVVGPDQVNSHFMEAKKYAKEKGKEVIVLSRTEGICSTDIKKNR